ncbi:fumarylacetoacetate hydrolase domain-containing protein 2-like isoform X2 [Protopterus annectens]|uniref:fumarylacetoacetate hydrolase domain-containing protein 2-like isoform X2 n=1 Tax=Protopterus annectens TaxID=7888 RepID=UPI001CFA2235|nr:fumarylacetoacetate hydrolase domain-containing protein 2-like isoform X2 [Protopterus annectens]
MSLFVRPASRVCSGLQNSHHYLKRGVSSTMRLIQFKHKSSEEIRLGVEQKEGGNVIDLNAFEPSLPCTMRQFLEKGEAALVTAKRAQELGKNVLERSEVNLLPPVTNPDKIICVGMNYADHCAELNVPTPKEPVIFNKFPSSIVGPYDSIILPKESKTAEAMEYVAGFTVALDVSARDWLTKTSNGNQWLLGKSFDTFCPLGPALVTKDSLSDPHNLGIQCRVNGETVQKSKTSLMIFKTEALIAWVSQFVTLYPGDIFLTGTPPGVGLFKTPPTFLKPGDTIECDIDEIGIIRNKVI